MNFIKEQLAFEQWLYTNHLPPMAQLLWHKIFMLFNGAGWPEWIAVENQALMVRLHLKNETSFIRYRDMLLTNGFIEYQKGRKGTPNRYKMNSVVEMVSTCKSQVKNKDLQIASTNDSTNDSINDSQNGVQTIVQTAHTETEPIKAIQHHYETYIGGLISSPMYLEIKDFLESGIEPALICAAIDKAVAANKRSWLYARKILNNCVIGGIFTLEQFKVDNANWEASRNKKDTKGGENYNHVSNIRNTKPTDPDPYEGIESSDF